MFETSKYKNDEIDGAIEDESMRDWNEFIIRIYEVDLKKKNKLKLLKHSKSVVIIKELSGKMWDNLNFHSDSVTCFIWLDYHEDIILLSLEHPWLVFEIELFKDEEYSLVKVQYQSGKRINFKSFCPCCNSVMVTIEKEPYQ